MKKFLSVLSAALSFGMAAKEKVVEVASKMESLQAIPTPMNREQRRAHNRSFRGRPWMAK